MSCLCFWYSRGWTSFCGKTFDCPAYCSILIWERCTAIFWGPAPTLSSFFTWHDPRVIAKFLHTWMFCTHCVCQVYVARRYFRGAAALVAIFHLQLSLPLCWRTWVHQNNLIRCLVVCFYHRNNIIIMFQFRLMVNWPNDPKMNEWMDEWMNATRPQLARRCKQASRHQPCQSGSHGR